MSLMESFKPCCELVQMSCGMEWYKSGIRPSTSCFTRQTLEEGRAAVLLKDLISLGFWENQIQESIEMSEGSEGWFAQAGVDLHWVDTTDVSEMSEVPTWQWSLKNSTWEPCQGNRAAVPSKEKRKCHKWHFLLFEPLKCIIKAVCSAGSLVCQIGWALASAGVQGRIWECRGSTECLGSAVGRQNSAWQKTATLCARKLFCSPSSSPPSFKLIL